MGASQDLWCWTTPTFHSLVALKLVCRAWCRDTAATLTVNNSHSRRECEVGYGNAAIAEPELTICKRAYETTAVGVCERSKIELVALRYFAGNWKYWSAYMMSRIRIEATYEWGWPAY